jgi:hypothetical protein
MACRRNRWIRDACRFVKMKRFPVLSRGEFSLPPDCECAINADSNLKPYIAKESKKVKEFTDKFKKSSIRSCEVVE